jgi:hypothetical protein
LCTKI